MQVTLVSYYGTKPAELSSLIYSCQSIISKYAHRAFHRYDIEQVHGTVVTLDGIVTDGQVKNRNFQVLRGEERVMNFDHILGFINSNNVLPIDIQIGGFRRGGAYPFTSHGQHPYLRSFSVREDIVVAMGWPIEGTRYSDSLNQLRSEFQKVNVLHAYHAHTTDVDNDFYFVLGRISRILLGARLISQAEEAVRTYLGGLNPLVIPLGREQLTIVGYEDSRLPLATSCSIPIAQAKGDVIRSLYFTGSM